MYMSYSNGMLNFKNEHVIFKNAPGVGVTPFAVHYEKIRIQLRGKAIICS